MNVNFITNNCNIVNNGQYNMDFDEKTLNSAIGDNVDFALVRFYQWHPKCVSLGRNQDNNINYKNIDIVNRKTGGRALLHDKELTYSVVCPIFDESIVRSYKKISNCLILGFKTLGIELNFGSFEHRNSTYCFNTTSRADICYNNKKFIGSAQYRKKGYLLQHGSIPYSLDWSLIEEIFHEKIDREKIITLNEINDSFSTRQIIDALKQGFIEGFKDISQ